MRVAAFLCLLAGLGSSPVALRAQSVGAITGQAQASLVARPETPAAGARDADVTIVEFLDYNCPYCKKTAPELRKLLGADHRVRVVIKEWPIFGDVSLYAAQSALAANWQGKFLVAHAALIASRADLEATSQVDSILRGVGVNVAQLSEDRKRHAASINASLARYANEARALGLKGTPGFVIGRQVVSTALDLTSLQHLVANARSTH